MRLYYLGLGLVTLFFGTNTVHAISTNNCTTDSKLISAYYGGNQIPIRGVNLDGLPITFSKEIRDTRINANDIRVIQQNGTKVIPQIATLAPANEEDEDRTILLVGEFGEPNANPPVEVEIVGNIMTEDGTNVYGQRIGVINFYTGTYLILAENIGFNNQQCRNGTLIKTTWIGGIRPTAQYGLNDISVTLSNGSKINPIATDDINDNDNILDLYLAGNVNPVSVEIAANVFTDPKGLLNTVTSTAVCPNQ